MYKESKELDTYINLSVVDASGKQLFSDIVRSQYRRVKIAFFVYDVSNVSSFHNIQKWIQDFRQGIKEAWEKEEDDADERPCESVDHVNYYVLGNKCDLKNERKVTTEEA